MLCLVVAGLAAASNRIAYAADDCLSAPKAKTPQGKHWYYRVERQTKRACWYLGEEGRSTSRTSTVSNAKTPPVQAPPEQKPTVDLTQQPPAPMPPAVSNARAELAPEIAVPFTPPPPLGRQFDNAQALPETHAAQRNETELPASRWRLAERWPDSRALNRVAQADTVAPASVPAQAIPGNRNSPALSVLPDTPAVSATTASAVEQDNTYEMLRIVLGVITAAIALAAIFGRLILSHLRPLGRPVQRRPIWQTIDDHNAQPTYAPVCIRDPSLRAQAERDVEELLRALRYPEGQHPTSPTASASRGQRPTGRSGARA